MVIRARVTEEYPTKKLTENDFQTMKYIHLLLICSFLISSCAPKLGCSNLGPEEKCTRVFFIGNSYTYVNNLPDVFARLSFSGGHKVETGIAAGGGWMLSDAVKEKDTIDGLASKRWNYVVLQEQSQTPASTESRTTSMLPAVRELTGLIYPTGGIPILFITWGHREGWSDNGLPDYESMQNAINAGYMEVSRELNIAAVPVGYAWQAVHSQFPQINLWQADGSHPSAAGTYLAACVFYTVIFGESPEKLDYYGKVDKSSALTLQKAVADTVLNDEGQWKLP
jgi:hypothetical protein